MPSPPSLSARGKQEERDGACLSLLSHHPALALGRSLSSMLPTLLTPAAASYRVTGEEEIPEGAIAVLTSDAPDVLSHVSVRARNMKVLFATCYDDKPLQAGTTCSSRDLPRGICLWVSCLPVSGLAQRGVGCGVCCAPPASPFVEPCYPFWSRTSVEPPFPPPHLLRTTGPAAAVGKGDHDQGDGFRRGAVERGTCGGRRRQRSRAWGRGAVATFSRSQAT